MARPGAGPMRALAVHQLRADAAGLAGQAFIVAVAGGMLSLLFSVLRLSGSGLGMPESSQAVATNAVLWIIGSCLVILPQVGRFGIERRRYDYACWAIAGMPFARTAGIIGLGVAASLLAGIAGGVAFALAGAPLLARAPIVISGQPAFVPGVPLAPAPADYVASFAIVTGLVAFSGLLGAWRIARTPARLALAGTGREPRRSLARRVLGSGHAWLAAAVVSVASGWLMFRDQAGLFVSIGSILALVWAGGVVRGGWIRQVHKLLIGLFPRRPLAYGSCGLATESLRLDPIVLYPVLFAMGVVPVILTVSQVEGIATNSESTMTVMDLVVLFFGPIAMAIATAVTGMWLGASSLGRTMRFLGVLGLPRGACLASAGLSQVYLVTLSLVLVVAACVAGGVIELLIAGIRSVPGILAVTVQALPSGYLGVVFLVVVIPSVLISVIAHAVSLPGDRAAGAVA